MAIKEEIAELTNEINQKYARIQQLQESCPHTDCTGAYGANTGNYDPSADSYWINATCDECGKRFHYYSTEPEYRTFKFKKISW
jgi:hypothetical protein